MNDVSLCETFACWSVSWTKCILSSWLKSISNISNGILPLHWSCNVLKLECAVCPRICFHIRVLMSLSFSDTGHLFAVSKFSAEFKGWSTFSSSADASPKIEIVYVFHVQLFIYNLLGNFAIFFLFVTFYALSLPLLVLIVFLSLCISVDYCFGVTIFRIYRW